MVFIEKLLRLGRKIIPTKIFKATQPAYHWVLASSAVLFYRFPSRKLFVIGVTGTKGKTSTIEIINAILEKNGYKTALSSGLRFKIGKESEKNTLKMTMPGRFFIQKFLRKAVRAKCDYVILELTSEGAKQNRHRYISFDIMIFTNLTPEHIESHGSFEKYRGAKLKLFKALEQSEKKQKTIIVNEDDSNHEHFLNFKVEEKIKYGRSRLTSCNIHEKGIDFILGSEKFKSKLFGEFNLYNILTAIALAKSLKIETQTIKIAIEQFNGISGRMEKIKLGPLDSARGKQDFTVIVDYAHTPESLEKVYETFQASKKICVLGSTGGGRDKWKRPEMGKIASKHCSRIILTNEDPYDEDPKEIIKDIEKGIINPSREIILDRREAIQKALQYAKTGDAVIITGKGSDPWIMGPKGTKTEWSDRDVTKEELKKLK